MTENDRIVAVYVPKVAIKSHINIKGAGISSYPCGQAPIFDDEVPFPEPLNVAV